MLPSKVYRSRSLLADEEQRLFALGWVCVGRAETYAVDGSYRSHSVGGLPIVVIRSAGRLQGFLNSCIHRRATIVEREGVSQRLVCPYHGWVYTLDGKLIAAPHHPVSPDLMEPNQLTPIEVIDWRGFVFVRVQIPSDSAAAFDDTAGFNGAVSHVEDAMAIYQPADYDLVHEATELWACDWKLLVENFLDTYHLFKVHRDTFAANGDKHATTTFGKADAAAAHQRVVDPPDARHGIAAADDRRFEAGAPAGRTTIVGAIFPGLLVQLQPDWMWHLTVHPAGVGYVRISWGLSIAPTTMATISNPTAYVEELVAYLEKVNSEDRAIVERVQEGIAVDGPTAPLAPLEANVMDFDRWWTNQMSENPR